MCVFNSLMPKCGFSRVKIGSIVVAIIYIDRLPFIRFEQTKLRWSSWDNTWYNVKSCYYVVLTPKIFIFYWNRDFSHFAIRTCPHTRFPRFTSYFQQRLCIINEVSKMASPLPSALPSNFSCYISDSLGDVTRDYFEKFGMKNRHNQYSALLSTIEWRTISQTTTVKPIQMLLTKIQILI